MKRLFYILLAIAPLSVFAQPGLPHQFYGSVNGGSPGDVVRAIINGETVAASVVTSDGRYGIQPDVLIVPDPDGDRSGATISFVFGKILSGTHATFVPGAVSKVDLSPATGGGSSSGGSSSTITTVVYDLFDLNRDGEVSFLDFALLLEKWGTKDTDVNNDGVTDILDFNTLMAHWSL